MHRLPPVPGDFSASHLGEGVLDAVCLGSGPDELYEAQHRTPDALGGTGTYLGGTYLGAPVRTDVRRLPARRVVDLGQRLGPRHGAGHHPERQTRQATAPEGRSMPETTANSATLASPRSFDAVGGRTS
ncbi:hypothetical protein [Streptomyces halobius]|uniref:Uncharacterized protein n=1 Tax=Streptomyces halobius TaxID=2879846 RepID=A0ABY4M9C3_9ACTN|nr:hypothetical protein [Streptomyces halobius]UQA93997.1 hypothetical protein K9S39_20850 [Streptomyces halobius]